MNGLYTDLLAPLEANLLYYNKGRMAVGVQSPCLLCLVLVAISSIPYCPYTTARREPQFREIIIKAWSAKLFHWLSPHFWTFDNIFFHIYNIYIVLNNKNIFIKWTFFGTKHFSKARIRKRIKDEKKKKAFDWGHYTRRLNGNSIEFNSCFLHSNNACNSTKCKRA